MADNYKIYMHKNKINGKVYIGQTKQTLNHRWNNGKGYDRCPYFYNAIKKYGWENFEHMLIIDGLTKEQADELEKEFIQKYKSYDMEYGYNISLGGSGLTGATKYIDIYKYDLDGTFLKHYNDISEIIIENPNYNSSCIRYCYDEKIQSAYGYQWKSYYKEKIEKLESFEERVSNQKSIKVYQYTLDGYFVNEYKSFREAGNQNNLEETSISKCCRGLLKTYGNYQWRMFYSEKIESISPVICQYDLDGNLLHIYDSLEEAELKTNTNRSSIINCYAGRYEMGGNYVWRKYNNKENVFCKIDIVFSKIKLIQLIDDDNNIIKTFKSARSASKELGFKDASGIIKVCKGIRKKTHGMKFKYAS